VRAERGARPPSRERDLLMTRTRALPGVTNVLEDLGFDDADELSTKALLAVKLNALIDERGLRQAEAARVMGLTQPRVSQLRHYSCSTALRAIRDT
jgi:predicted XRE-type DNA-binding protein